MRRLLKLLGLSVVTTFTMLSIVGCKPQPTEQFNTQPNTPSKAQPNTPSNTQIKTENTSNTPSEFQAYSVDQTQSKHPQAIITLSPHLTELMFSLGLEDKLIATVEYSDYPARAKIIPRVGNAFQLDWERLALLKPDAILAWQGGNPNTLLEKLEQQGYVVLRFENASLFALPEQLKLLATKLGLYKSIQKNIQKLTAQYIQGLESLEQKYSQKKPVKVFYQVSAEPIYTVDGTHTISEMLRVCGAVNVFPHLGKTKAPISPEAVLAALPDVILTTEFSVQAVQEVWEKTFLAKNILSIPADEVSRASLRMLQGTQNICEVLDQWRRSAS